MKNRKLILILIVFSFILLCESNTTLKFYEKKNLTPLKAITYSDNSVVFRLVQRKNNDCNVPNLTYRILYPNGTDKTITVYHHIHQIPRSNFCASNSIDSQSKILVIDSLATFKTITNYILVVYEKFIKRSNTTSKFGMMIDRNGRITSNTLLGNFTDDHKLYYIEDNQANYLFIEDNKNKNYAILRKFITSSNTGKLVKIPKKTIQMPEGYERFYIYNTVDYDILFVFVFHNISQILTLEPEWRVTGSILQKESTQLSNQFLIYQTSVPQLEDPSVGCDKFYNGSGFYCDISFHNSTKGASNYPVVKVTFLSNGQITGTEKEFDIDLKNFGTDLKDINGTLYFNLPSFIAPKSGGIMIILSNGKSDKCTYLLNFDNFNNPINANAPCFAVTSMNNNTALIIQDINVKENSWTIKTIDIHRNMNDKGYDNPIINWAEPAINEYITVEMANIKIAYNVPIECSSQSISIYQKMVDKEDLLRETYSGQSSNCQVLSDNTTLSLPVLSSTFNQPDSTYYIKIDPGFVRQDKTLESIPGISKYQWTFFTKPQYYEIDDSVDTFVRLIPNVTLYFEKLSFEEKSNYSQNLIHQLAEIIPISNERIKTNNNYKKDSTSLNQILIPIRIIKSNDNTVINVSTIVNTLDTLIKNKEITSISRNNISHWKCHMQIIFIFDEICVTLIELFHFIFKHQISIIPHLYK